MIIIDTIREGIQEKDRHQGRTPRPEVQPGDTTCCSHYGNNTLKYLLSINNNNNNNNNHYYNKLQ